MDTTGKESVNIKSINSKDLKKSERYHFLKFWNYNTRKRIFTKGSTKVHLIGMIHVADKNYYEEIIKDIPVDSSITLSEGLNDKTDFKKNLTSFDYKEMATVLRMIPQSNYSKSFPNILNSDLDWSDFSQDLKNTLINVDSIMKAIVKLLKKEIGLTEALDLLKKEDMKGTTGFMQSEGQIRQVLTNRNDNLWNNILLNQDKYLNIIVPWGAKHLPDIEKRLLGMGYTLENEKNYKAVNIVRLGLRVTPILLGSVLRK